MQWSNTNPFIWSHTFINAPTPFTFETNIHYITLTQWVIVVGAGNRVLWLYLTTFQSSQLNTFFLIFSHFPSKSFTPNRCHDSSWRQILGFASFVFMHPVCVRSFWISFSPSNLLSMTLWIQFHSSYMANYHIFKCIRWLLNPRKTS